MSEGLPSRDVAEKVFVSELYSGSEFARVRVLATVVRKFVSDTGSFASLTIDDGSDTIEARVFKEDLGLVDLVKPGDIVDVVGRPKEYNGEDYISLESAAILKDPNWEMLRKLELFMRPERDLSPPRKDEFVKEEAQAPVVEEESISEDKGLVLLEMLEKMDEGDGVSYAELLAKISFSEAQLEEALGDLMGKGDIYEPKIGRFKRV